MAIPRYPMIPLFRSIVCPPPRPIPAPAMADSQWRLTYPPSAIRQGCQDLVDLLARQLLVITVVHLHHGCSTTRTQALHLQQGEGSVGRVLARLDAKPAADVLQDMLCSQQRAGQGGAHLDHE